MNHSTPDTQTIAILLAIIAKQQVEFAKLEECCKELAGRLNLNSQNSSKPPSIDGYAKPSSSGGSKQNDAVAPAIPLTRKRKTTNQTPKAYASRLTVKLAGSMTARVAHSNRSLLPSIPTVIG